MVLVPFLAVLSLGTFAANAAPTSKLRAKDSITTLSSSQIVSYKRISHYASAGYCKPAATLAWTCGTDCTSNKGFRPVASGGDGTHNQYWFVGYDPTLESVIVSHQGTNPSKIIPLITDAEIESVNLDSILFPGISTSIEVHDGFAKAHAKAAPDVLAAVQTALSTYGASMVTMTGHSLGAAIALLDSISLPLHLDSGIAYKMVGYGMPRVGNQEFADHIDSTRPVTHINNKEDFVPILPGRFLGFHHPSGEVHIQDSGSWVSCPGQDNEGTECTVGDVPNILDGDEGDHDGPYDGIVMGADC